MVYLTRLDHARRARRLMVSGSNIHYMQGAGILDWLGSAASGIMNFVKLIIAPVANLAKDILLPSAVTAIQTGDMSQLKKGLVNTVKAAAPTVLEHTQKQALKAVEDHAPSAVKEVLPADTLASLASLLTNMANKKVQEIEGEGIKKRGRRRKIDKLVSGSGLLKYK